MIEECGQIPLRTSISILKFEAQAVLKRFLIESQKSNADLSDVLIACSAKQAGCEAVLSFDKKAIKTGIFESQH